MSLSLTMSKMSIFKSLRFKKRKPIGGEPVYLDWQAKSFSDPNLDREKLEKISRVLRGLAFATVEAVQSGHPGGSSSKVEQFVALSLSGVMAFDPLAPKSPGRDRLIWSAGHCTPLLHSANALYYECLRRAGRQFAEAVVQDIFLEDLLRFRHLDGPQGHAENYLPYSDASTGPSGHGFSYAGGLAILHRSNGLDTKIWVMMGDMESEEGMTYEARNLLSTNGLDNVIVSLDYNHIGLDGRLEEIISSPYLNHWLGLGWNVIEVGGHDVLALLEAYKKAREGFNNSLPTVVIAHTIKGKDYGTKEDTPDSHGAPVKHEEYVTIMKKLGFDIKGEKGKVMGDIFKIMEEIKLEDEEYVVKQLEVGAKEIKPESELSLQIKKVLTGRKIVQPHLIRRPKKLPPELVFKAGEKVATREALQAWLKWFTEESAFVYSGSGDLARSTFTNAAEKVQGIFSKENPLGRGIKFGIAEQNMAMMSIAISQDILPGGFQAVSAFGTFAVFTAMLSHAVRLGLYNNQVKSENPGFFILIASHDGPETGEDGPTHQGLYWMSIFQAYPGIKVYKPTDANETIEMLFYALEQGEPIALATTRVGVPVMERGGERPPALAANNGAYIYKNYSGQGKKKLAVVVSGGLVLRNLLTVVPELERAGRDLKIVVATSPELFDEFRKTNPAEAEEIFSEFDRAQAVILHNGWKGFLASFLLPKDAGHRSIGVDTYLKSGNAEEVYGLTELTPEKLAERLLKLS